MVGKKEIFITPISVSSLVYSSTLATTWFLIWQYLKIEELESKFSYSRNYLKITYRYLLGW